VKRDQVDHTVNGKDDEVTGCGAFAAGFSTRSGQGDGHVEQEKGYRSDAQEDEHIDHGPHDGLEGPFGLDGGLEHLRVKQQNCQENGEAQAQLAKDPTKAVEDLGEGVHVLPFDEGTVEL